MTSNPPRQDECSHCYESKCRVCGHREPPLAEDDLRRALERANARIQQLTLLVDLTDIPKRKP